MGVGTALIQKKEVSEEDVRAAFTLTFFWGILFFGLYWLLAPFVVYIFDNKIVISIIRVMSFSFILTGLNTTALSLMRRSLEFRYLAVIESVSYLLGFGIVGIVMAYRGFGVWSLVAAALSQSTLLTIFSHIYCRHKIYFIYQWKFFKPLYAFGARISVIRILEFLGSYLDTIAIGYFFGAALLGIYNRAFMLVNLPAQYLTSSFSRVLFPSYSKIQKKTERLRKAYLSTSMLFSVILLPACFGIAASSREIVLIVLGEKWIAAIPVLQLLAIATPFNLLSHLGGVLCEATATLNIKLLMQIIYIFILGSLFFVLSSHGIIGFATALVICEFGRFVAYCFVLVRICRIRIREFMQAYLPSAISSILIGLLIFLAAIFLREQSVPVGFIFTIEILLGLSSLIILFVFGPYRILRREIRDRLQSSGFINSRDIESNKLIYRLCKSIL